MPAQRLNYVVVHRGQSQVYGSSSKEIALQTPLPDGVLIEDRMILFITYQPDGEILSVHPIPNEEVQGAELKVKTTRAKAVPVEEPV
jgi:hypothetical protein